MSFFKKKGKEKNGKEVKEKKNEEKKEKGVNKKQIRLKSNTPIRVVRVIMYVVLIICTIRGGATFFKPDPIEQMLQEQDKFKAELSKNNLVEGKAFSFAENFSREYFTLYPNEKDDYKQRLSKYMPLQIIESLDTDGYMLVNSVNAYDMSKYSDTQLDVYVYAKVEYKVEKPGQETISNVKQKLYDTSIRDVYIKVPIYFDGENMAVEGIPLIVGGPGLASVNNESYLDSNMAKESVASNIRASLNEFFKSYYQEKQTQVDYFLSIPGSIKAAGGKYTFNEFEETKIYDLGSNKYKAIVKYSVTDAGKKIRQTANLSIVYKDDKYIIENLDMRTRNIK